MKYLRVTWKHPDPAYPVLLYSELDERRFEVRKIEVFHDGHLGHASASEAHAGTELGTVAVPELGEIAADPQFEPAEIAAAEFEAVWNRRSQA